MFWAERDDLEMVRSLGVRYGQLGIPGSMRLTGAVAAQWKAALEAAGLTLVTVFAAYEGEDYADIPAVARTVGSVSYTHLSDRRARSSPVLHSGPSTFNCATISLMTTRTRSPSAAEIHSRRNRSSSMPICLRSLLSNRYRRSAL